MSNVTLDDITLKSWSHYFINFDNLTNLDSGLREAQDLERRIPTLFSGQFVFSNATDQPRDTFLRVDGFGKGVALINGFNLGRYWPKEGPQVTLYVPKHLFKAFPEKNTIQLFELQEWPAACGRVENVESGESCEISFVKKSKIDGPIPETCKNCN